MLGPREQLGWSSAAKIGERIPLGREWIDDIVRKLLLVVRVQLGEKLTELPGW